MTQRTAFITGVAGQDGSYLAELLLAKGYVVHGLVRRNTTANLRRIRASLGHPRFRLHDADILGTESPHALLARIRPDELYHLAGQSHVGLSFEAPDYCAQVNALGTLRLLTALRELGLGTRFYQASTSELFDGGAGQTTFDERSPIAPVSPYAAGKLLAHWSARYHREAFGMHVSIGILFNHESPRRRRSFVTRKISKGVARIAQGRQALIRLGNLDAERDWGYAPEYVEVMWRMLQQDAPDDYVVGTGVSCTVRDFVALCFAEAGMEIEWSGAGAAEAGHERRTGLLRVMVDPALYRPSDARRRRADPTKIARALDWRARIHAPALARLMVRHDLAPAPCLDQPVSAVAMSGPLT